MIDDDVVVVVKIIIAVPIVVAPLGFNSMIKVFSE